MKPADRQSKLYIDPLTARAIALALFVIAAAMLFVSGRALSTGCVGLMRGRHGPAVLHCAPATAYWSATLVLLVVGFVAALASAYFWRVARMKTDIRSVRS